MRSFHRNITIEEYNKRVKVKDQEIAFLQTENYALKNELRIKGAADEAVQEKLTSALQENIEIQAQLNKVL